MAPSPPTPRWRRESDRKAAAGDFPGAFAARPAAGGGRLARARTLLGGQEFNSAIHELDKALRSEPGDVLVLAMKSAALMDLGRYGEAAEISGGISKRFADDAHAHLVHAGALRAAGQTQQAIGAYEACLVLDPACAEAWLSLANLKTYRFTTDQRRAMEASFAVGPGDPEDFAKLCFALGKAREDGGEVEGAFEAFARGNAIEARRRGFNPDETSAFVQRSKAFYSPAFFAGRAGWGAAASDPIFIVGLPRSGSTLVEQILASHPSIEGTHELPDLPMVAQAVPGYPEGVARLTREQCRRLGERYLERTKAYRHQNRPRFIDKTPKNFLHAGFIHLVLPGARIIDVRRHPLDCGVSIFKQHFGAGFNPAFDLGHIGRYYADYVDLMAHFDKAAPEAVHRVIYERLVDDTEGEVRALLAWLGLPFDEACLRFFENRRPVDTPSSEQVRQPIFTGGVGSWRQFEPWIGPLKQALGPTLDAYPDVPAG